MQRGPLTCLLSILILALTAQNVRAQAPLGVASITNVTYPASVGIGQPLTVTVSTSYILNPLDGESLIIEISEHTEMSGPLPATATPSGDCYPSQSMQALCVAVTGLDISGNFSVSFALRAPNQPETWRPNVLAYITPMSAVSGSMAEISVQTLSITVTTT